MTRFKRWKQRIHPGRIAYSGLEWLLMRLAFAILLYSSFRSAGYDALHWFVSPGRGADFTTQPAPRGIAQFVDLTWITDPRFIPQLCAAVALCLVLLVSGRFLVLASLGLALIQTFIGTLEISRGGNVFHTSNILVFGLLGIALGGIMPWFRKRKQSEDGEVWRTVSRSRTIYFVQQLMATTYVVSAVSKLWLSKGRWSLQVADIGLQFEKRRAQQFYQTLEPPDVIPWAVDAVNQHPVLTMILFSGGLFLELFCLLALVNRGMMLLFGSGLAVMHVMIIQLMGLDFHYNIWMLVIFFINIPFWLLLAAQKLNRAA